MNALHLKRGYGRAISRQIDRLDATYTDEGQAHLDWLLGMFDHYHAIANDANWSGGGESFC